MYTSVGTSMGLGKRHEPLDGQPVNHPGVGTYDIGKDAGDNPNPTWKFGTSVRKDPKKCYAAAKVDEINRPRFKIQNEPEDMNYPSYTTHGRKTKFPA